MKRTRRTVARGRLSLRSRLLAGLITVTALFLIVMGVVTTIVLGNYDQSQFDNELVLTTHIKLSDVAALQSGYAAAYINVPSRSVGVLSQPSASATELQGFLQYLLATGQARAFFSAAQHPAQTLFVISQPGEPRMTAVWRAVTAREAQHSNGLLPRGGASWSSGAWTARWAMRTAA